MLFVVKCAMVKTWNDFPYMGMIIPSLIGNCIPVALTLLLHGGWVLQTFFHTAPLVDSGTSDFLAWAIPGASPVFLALSTTVVSAPWKNRGLCGSAEWPKLPLHLGVVGRWSGEYLLTVSGKKQPPNSKSTLVFNGFSKHWDRGGRHRIDDTPWWAYWFDLLTVNIV